MEKQKVLYDSLNEGREQKNQCILCNYLGDLVEITIKSYEQDEISYHGIVTYNQMHSDNKDNHNFYVYNEIILFTNFGETIKIKDKGTKIIKILSNTTIADNVVKILRDYHKSIINLMSDPENQEMIELFYSVMYYFDKINKEQEFDTKKDFISKLSKELDCPTDKNKHIILKNVGFDNIKLSFNVSKNLYKDKNKIKFFQINLKTIVDEKHYGKFLNINKDGIKEIIYDDMEKNRIKIIEKNKLESIYKTNEMYNSPIFRISNSGSYFSITDTNLLSYSLMIKFEPRREMILSNRSVNIVKDFIKTIHFLL